MKDTLGQSIIIVFRKALEMHNKHTRAYTFAEPQIFQDWPILCLLSVFTHGLYITLVTSYFSRYIL